MSLFTSTLNLRTKDVHGQPVHLCKAAKIFSREHPRKMFVGCMHDLLETLHDVNIAKRGRASLRKNDNILPQLHCERRPILTPKLADTREVWRLSY
jgi:hypothetical protein